MDTTKMQITTDGPAKPLPAPAPARKSYLMPTGRGSGSLLRETTSGLSIRPVREADSAELSSVKRPEGLIAGKVNAGIDFNAPQPRNADTIQMYRRPADKNAAATGVSAGANLDVQA